MKLSGSMPTLLKNLGKVATEPDLILVKQNLIGHSRHKRIKRLWEMLQRTYYI